MISFIISNILNYTVHISGPFCVIFKTFYLIVINYFILTELLVCGFLINRILPLKNSCTHLQADNRVLVMLRGPLDILKKVLGMHAQVVTKPSLATSGQLIIRYITILHNYVLSSIKYISSFALFINFRSHFIFYRGSFCLLFVKML